MRGEKVLPSALYIQKEFAELIMKGEKTVELRKTPLAKDRTGVYFPLIIKGTRDIPGLIKISDTFALDDAKFKAMGKAHRVGGANVYKFGWSIDAFVPFAKPITGLQSKTGAQTWYSLDSAQMQLVIQALNNYHDS